MSTAATSPHARAGISIDDRAFVFGDGVYEVCEVSGGLPIDEPRHLARLARSLEALRIAPPVAEAALRRVMREVIARNRVRDGLVYIQVTRGAAKRDHGFPAAPRPALVVTAKSLDPRVNEARAAVGVKVDHRAGRALGASRHQDAAAAAQRARQAARAGGGRVRDLVRRRATAL